MKNRRIIFNLKREWYDKIASGEKTVEYRRICKHWAVRVGCRWPIQKHCMDALRCGVTLGQDWVAVFRLGYSRKHSDIVRRITKIDIGPCHYDGWNGEYFRVYFVKEGDQMASDNETVEDIVREMRDGVVARGWMEQTLREFADRIDAAHKREVADLRRRLKVAEDALEKCNDGMRGRVQTAIF